MSEFQRCLLGRTLSSLGDTTLLAAAVLVLHKQLSSSVGVAVLFGIAALPQIALARFIGRVVDRQRPHVVLASGASLSFVGCVVVAASNNLWVLLTGFAVVQCSQAFLGPAWQSLVPMMVRPDALDRSVGLWQSVPAVTGALGFPLGALLFEVSHSAQLAGLVDGGTFLFLLVTASFLKAGRDRRPDNQVQMSAHKQSGFKWLRTNRVARQLVLGIFGVVVATEAINIAEVYLVRSAAGLSELWFGAVGATQAIGMIVGSIVVGPYLLRVIGRRGPPVSSIAGCTALVLSGWQPTAVPLIFFSLIAAMAFGGLSTMVLSRLLREAPPEIRGSTMAGLGAVSRLATLMGLAVGFVLNEWFGPRWAYGILGTIGCGAGLCWLLSENRLE